MDKLPKIGNDSSTNRSNSSTGYFLFVLLLHSNWADKKSLNFSLYDISIFILFRGSTNSSLDSVFFY